MPIATRLTNTGTLLVNGSFDENTSIAPSQFRTTSTTVSASTLDEVSLATGAVSFNGSTTLLSVPYSSNFDFGSGDFTIEFWMYTSSSGNATKGLMAFSHNASNIAQALWYFPTASTITFWCSSNGTSFDVASNVAAGTFALNNWYHVAVSRSGSSIRLFFAGVLQSTVTFGGTLAGTYDRNWIGSTVGNGHYNGLLSNIRVVKGTALYTANFAPPQAILPAVTNTQLLLNVTSSADFIKDNSTSNLTVTNVGPATWTTNGPFNQGSTTLEQRQVNDGTLEVATQFDEFTGAPIVDSNLILWLDAVQPDSYPGTGTTWTNLTGLVANATLNANVAFTESQGGAMVLSSGGAINSATSNMTIANQHTVSVWVQPTIVNSSIRRYLTINTALDTIVIRNDGITGPQPGQLHYYVNIGGISRDIRVSNQVVVDQTANFVGTWNGSTMTLYKNGTQVGNLSVSGTLATTVNTNYRISSVTEGMVGNFFQAQVYDRALSAQEVLDNFNAIRGRYGV
jgi:hypothetical protein